jgi:hypothetical protein
MRNGSVVLKRWKNTRHSYEEYVKKTYEIAQNAAENRNHPFDIVGPILEGQGPVIHQNIW